VRGAGERRGRRNDRPATTEKLAELVGGYGAPTADERCHLAFAANPKNGSQKPGSAEGETDPTN
jgi:hypothetical protein